MKTTTQQRFRYFAIYTSMFIIAISLLVVVGWITKNAMLKQVHNDYVPMKPNTAAGLILISFALILHTSALFTRLKVVAYITTAASLCIGLFALVQNLSITELTLHELTKLEQEAPHLYDPGKVSVFTAISFVLSAIALLLIKSENITYRTISQYLLHGVTFIAAVSALGYLFKIESIYTYPLYWPMAIHTAVCFLLFSVAASLINPELGFTGLFTGKGIGNIMARNLFIKISLTMVVVGYIVVIINRHNLVHQSLTTAIFAVTIIVISLLFIRETSKMLNKQEQRKEFVTDKLNRVFEALPTALVMANKEGTILLVNKETERMFGYSKKEMLGKQIEMFLPHHLRQSHPEKMKKFFVAPEVRNYSSSANLYAVDKQGREFPVEMGFTPIETEAGMAGLASVVDITDRKMSEKIIQEQLRELRIKNQEMEQFNYIASHDLQEPLRTVSNYITLLEEDYPDKVEGEIAFHLSNMQEATNRMSRLIRNLLDYGLIGRDRQLTITNINRVVADVVADLNGLITTTNATIYIDTELPVQYAYETELRQLFQNLINNAIKFRKKGINPEIHIGHNVMDGHVEYYVADNGIGISPKHTRSIFNMFQRLNHQDDYEGYGVGLANCKKIAELHGGKIWVESEYGEGSTFKFSILNLKP